MLYFLHGGHTGPLLVYVKIIFTVSVKKILKLKILIINFNLIYEYYVPNNTRYMKLDLYNLEVIANTY